MFTTACAGGWWKMQLARAIFWALLAPLAVVTAACWPEGEETAPPEPTVGISRMSLGDVYSRLAEAVARPGMVFYTVAQVEGRYLEGTLSGEMQIWLDVERDLGRQELRGEFPADVAPYEETTIVAGGASYRHTADRPTEAGAAPPCPGTNSAALSLLLGWWPCWEDFPAQVMTGVSYGGRPAVRVVTEGTSWGEDEFTFETTIHLDEASFLPLATSVHWADSGERGQSFEFTMLFDNEFVPTDSLPPDFFDPAFMGYVYRDPAEPLHDLDPSLTVYWLGKEFPADGGLPGLALSSVYIPEQGSGPGYEAILDYRLADEPFGPASVTLQEWRLEEWQAFLDQARGGNWWDSPCVQSEERAIEGGSVVIFKGYNEMPLPMPSGTPVLPEEVTCPASPPDRFIAQAYLPATFILVDAPGVGGPHPTESPYNSPEGMEAILRGLKPR